MRRIKYPRTPHLPWSRPNKDDEQLFDVSQFEGREVVVTEKMDGENTTMGPDYVHARSLDSRHHPSRTWVKSLHATLCGQIPEGWRLCGENLFAVHSIVYQELESYFYLFSIWTEAKYCLSWNDTERWADRLNLPTPPVLYRGIWNEALIRHLEIDVASCEGVVVRTRHGFAHAEFGRHVAKWVRAGHVQTDEHWMSGPVVPNGLRESSR